MYVFIITVIIIAFRINSDYLLRRVICEIVNLS